MAIKPFKHSAVKQVFDAYPVTVKPAMLELRELIFLVAQQTPNVGNLTETLKWGEPAYLTEQSKSGSTIRIDWKPDRPDTCSVFFNCKTNLVETFRVMFPDDFEYAGNRELILPLDIKPIKDSLAFCVAASLTYHLKTKKAASRA